MKIFNNTHLSLTAYLTALLLVCACGSVTDPIGSSDLDGGTDTDTDGDTDSDTDTDTDTDSDTDTDTDSDTDTDTGPVTEEYICDDLDDDSDSEIDEGCDDDSDDYCDENMAISGTPLECPNGGYDCDDTDPDIYPGSTIHQEGIDYDCDGLNEYMMTLVISVDDLLVDLCLNGNFVPTLGTYSNQWPYTDTYSLVMETGNNTLGIHGQDTGASISAFIATVEVDGQEFRTDGVMPPSSSIAYTSSDPEWSQTEWRYFPTLATGPEVNWCHSVFDDSSWGPAIRSGIDGSTPVSNWGWLGYAPWTFGCPTAPYCPGDFYPYYTDSISNNEPMWVWDYNPTSLADAWFRLNVAIP